MAVEDNRLGKLENGMPQMERRFIGWRDNPWIPEQIKAAIRLHPEQRVFWRSMLSPVNSGQLAVSSEQLAGKSEQLAVSSNQPTANNIVTLDYAPHAAQMEIHRARGKRFRTVCTGRRFGKTLCLAAEMLERGGCEQGGDYGWVAPTYGVAERGIEAFRAIGNGFVRNFGRAPARVEFQGRDGFPRTRIWFLSADNPDNIRGFGFQGLVIDEAASMPQNVWHYVLRPTISQTLGWAVFVSTPMGRNWFYDLFTRGSDPSETDYKSFSFPSNASPFFPARRRSTPF